MHNRLGKDAYGRTVWTTPKSASKAQLQFDAMAKANRSFKVEKDTKIQPKWNTRSSERKKSNLEDKFQLATDNLQNEDEVKAKESMLSKQPYLESEIKVSKLGENMTLR